MIDKSKSSLSEVLSQIKDGATILIGGFGTAGQPAELIDGLIDLGVKDLTIVSNNAGNGDYGLAKLLKAGSIKKVICSFPRQSDSYVFDELYRAGKLNLNWYRKAIWRAVFRQQVWALGRCLPQLALEHFWPKAKKPVILMVKITCLSIRSRLTLP